MPSFYYPEGYFGPICDSAVDADDIAFRSRRATTEETKLVNVYTSGTNWWYNVPSARILVSIDCEQNPDGTFFNCEYKYSDGKVETGSDDYPGIISNKGFGLKDKFFVPDIDADSCSPFDPDINIRPRKYFNADGTSVLKYKRARSKPVTYPVDAGPKYGLSANAMTVAFNSAGTALTVTGAGTANVRLTLTWDDNPSTNGVALDSVSITDDSDATTTWTRSGSNGDQEETIVVTAGTYNLTFSNLNSANSPILVQNNSTKLCLKDSDGTDCNASFTIDDISNPEFDYDDFQWNADGREYGVWVNPEECTLPSEEQDVTYTIDIEETGTYAFSFGADDRGTVTLDETDVIFNDVTGGIFSTGAGSTPHTATRTLNRGKIKVLVSCTNSTLSSPSNSYSWAENPGGWFLKICKGSSCVSNNEIDDWLFSGTFPSWSNFMNSYAVFPSITDPLVGVAQSATWNIDVPDNDNYTLEVQADNNATITLDGTTVATSSSYTSSTTAILSNLSVGAHTIGATVTNTALGGTNVDSWANNPGGVAWTITRPASTNTENVVTTEIVPNAITARFDDEGNIIVEGDGSGRVQLLFEWDDNPDDNDTALGRLEIAGKTFVQTSGVRKGSDDYVFTATAGRTYNLNVINNSGGFSKDGNKKLCFRDTGGNDCNATLRINDVSNTGTTSKTTIESVTTTIAEKIIATSLDLQTTSGVDSNNIIWHTRKAVGYEEYTQ